MADYQMTATDVVRRTSDGACIPNDLDNFDRIAFEVWLASGGVPDPYVAPAAPTPTTVTPRQARLALLGAGLLDQVQAAVDAAGGATKITWEYATEINRADPLIAALAANLNLTPGQIDDLFVVAAAL